MTKLFISSISRGKIDAEVIRLFKQEKIKSWHINNFYIFLEIPDNEDVEC